MKKLLLSTILLVCAIVMKAQDVMVATLDGATGTKAYNGANAFINAVKDAQSGDRITLSPGTFKAPTIDKSLIIQGSGFVSDPDNGFYRTAIDGRLIIHLPQDDTNDLYIEGLYSNNEFYFESEKPITLNDLTIKKCVIGSLYLSHDGYRGSNISTNNALIEHCRISSLLLGGAKNKDANLTITNSVINAVPNNNEESSINFLNSVIIGNYSSTIARFENCIFTDDYCWMPAASVIEHCLSFFNRSFDNVLTKNVFWDSSADKVFVDATSEYSETASYELTDDAKSTFVDEYGDQIGLYGGISPYSPITSNPQILSRAIASRSSNGTLSVNVQVEGDIETYEYWFDTDYTKKQTGECSGIFDYDLNVSTLNEGIHLFNLRFRDTQGQWSSPITYNFYNVSYTPTSNEAIKVVSNDINTLIVPSDATVANIYLYTTSGQQVKHISIANPIGDIDLRPYYRDLESGLYIIKIEVSTKDRTIVNSYKLTAR